MPEITNLCVGYGDRKIFDKFDLSVERCRVMCIMGKSGCGKTTLLNCIASLIPYGGDIKEVGKISYVFQEGRLLPNKSVLGNVTYVLNCDKSEAENIAAEALKRMDIYDIKDKYPANISGGEASRVALARAFAIGGDTLLMDEPFRALDIGTKRGIISNFISGKPEGCSVIFVTHDIEEALMCADRVIVIGGSPCGILLDKNIDIPAEKRKVNDNELNKLRERLIAALS